MANTTMLTDADIARIQAAQPDAFAAGIAAAQAGRSLADNPHLDAQDFLGADGDLESDDDVTLAWHLGWEA